jgi:hypothetical protein
MLTQFAQHPDDGQIEWYAKAWFRPEDSVPIGLHNIQRDEQERNPR